MGGMADSLKGTLRQMNSSLFHWGVITNVNSEKYTFDAKIGSEDNREIKGIYINQSLTFSRAREVFMPVPNQTYVLLVKTDITECGFMHLGYFMPNGESVTSNKSNTKDGDLVYHRYLNPGEYQIVSAAGTELYMPDSGDLYIKNSKGFFIKFSHALDKLEVCVPDANIQSYKVDVSSGRVVRTSSASFQGAIQRNAETLEPFYEFSVNLGTMYNPVTSLPTGVATGSIVLSDRVHDVTGTTPVAYTGATNFLQFLLEMTSGVRVAVDDTGDFYVVNTSNNSRFKIGVGSGDTDISELLFKTETSELQADANNFSFIHKALGYFMKFNTSENGTSSLSLRIGDNTIVLDEASGLQITQASGAGIVYGHDGSITLVDSSGKMFSLASTGTTINGMSNPVTIFGDSLNIATDKGLIVGNPLFAVDGVLKATATAALFDSHVHAGPGAAPGPMMTPALLTLLTAGGIKVS